jgi:phosphoglucomutase
LNAEKETVMEISVLAGKPAPKNLLVDLTRLWQLSADAVKQSTLAREAITAKLTRAPVNNAPIGSLKVVAATGWFAARPSGTENIYKIYAESFKDLAHLKTILNEAQDMVTNALKSTVPGREPAEGEQ